MTVLRNRSNIAIFCGQFGMGLMHVIFSFYYVKVFLNIFHVGQYWFNIAQLLFMFWNAINDPLFGYIQDIGNSWMTDRLKIFTYFGPLMSLSFLVLWFPWGSTNTPPYVEGWHLIVSLFLYDAFFSTIAERYSCVGVAWSALFTESTRSHSKRVSGLKYAQLASLISSNIIALIERFSHSLDNFEVFQWMSVCVAIFSTICFFTTAHFGQFDGVLTRDCRKAHTKDGSSNPEDAVRLIEELAGDDKDDGSEDDDENVDRHLDNLAPPSNSMSASAQTSLASPKASSSWREILTVSSEIVAAPDFWRVVLTNFIHTCRSVMQLNFAAIIVDLLIPQTILPKGSWQLGDFFALCTALPQVIFIMNERLLLRLGAYGVFMRGFYFSIAASCVLYIFAADNPIVVMIFLVMDTRTISSLIFSLNALIVKPSISITPVVVVYLMNQNGYELYLKDGTHSPDLVRCALNLTFGTSLFLAALEIFTLSGYTLRVDNQQVTAKPRSLLHQL